MADSTALEGQIALVTGASRGIGFAIADRLASMGADVAISARNEAALHEAAAKLRMHGREVFLMPVDLTDTTGIDRLARGVALSLGPVDILVNNAGVGTFGPFQDTSEADWDSVIDTNLKSVFLLSRAVAPEMIRRQSGHIINIASLAGKNAFAGGAIYCASKWGLVGMTQCMAEDLRAYGIRVSAICPGTVETEFSPHSGKDPGKMLQPSDVAHAVAMLVTQAPQSFISEVLMRPTQKP